MNKSYIFFTILLVLFGSISFAQVRIEIMPPHTTDINGSGRGSGWKAIGSNDSSDNSIQEDVFELKNGSTIRGNLESFSGGTYFVNIGGILKAISEKSIYKINGELLSSVKTTSDNPVFEVIVTKTKDFSLVSSGLNNQNRIRYLNNKLSLTNNENEGYYKFKDINSDDFYIKTTNGEILLNPSPLKGVNPIIFGCPLKIDTNGIYVIPFTEMRKKYADVYFYIFGAKNLEGPVAKCDNKCKIYPKHCWDFSGMGYGRGIAPTINNYGNTEIAMVKSYSNDLVREIAFFRTSQKNHGVFTLSSELYVYKVDYNSMEKDNGYQYLNGNGNYGLKIGYGNFIDRKTKSWAILRWSNKYHKITNKRSSDLYIDILNEDVSKGIAKSFSINIVPSISNMSSCGINDRFCGAIVDVDNDGLLDFVFPEDWYCNDDYSKSIVIVKLKHSKMKK